jgi:hypothetical protein
LVDYLPADSGAQDSFDLIAQRMLGIIDQVVAANGGTVDLVNNQWIITLQDTTSPLLLSPTDQRMRRSANMTMKLAGQAITATSSVTAGVSLAPSRFADGVEHDFTGREMASSEGQAYSTKRSSTDDIEHIFALEYATPVTIDGVRFIEGDHFDDGGWFDTISVEVLVAGSWASVAATPSAALDETAPFQIIDFELASAMEVVGIRLRGMPGGTGNYVTIAELDGLLATLMGDANGDGVVDAADYITVKQNFGMTGVTEGAKQGDFDEDGKVEWDDLQTLMANFGTRSPGMAPAAPEPGSVMLLMFGAAALLCRRPCLRP